MTFITMIVTLQLINISVDPADPGGSREDLSINEIESCVELILEVLLDKTDAIKESDDQDETACSPNTNMIVLILPLPRVMVNDLVPESLVIHTFVDHTATLKSLHQKIAAPPPKVA